MNPTQYWDHIFFRYISILFFHLCLGHPSRLKFWMNFWSCLCTYLPCTSHLTWFDHSNNRWWRVQIMKHLIAVFTLLLSLPPFRVPVFFSGPTALTSAFLGPRYSPQHPVKGRFTHNMPFPCHAVPLPCSYNAVSFVKVCMVAGNIRTASPIV